MALAPLPAFAAAAPVGSVAAPTAAVIAPTHAAQAAVNTALAQLGRPYAWGAAGPNAFDCSGLALYAFKAPGTALPHSAAGQAQLGAPVALGALKPGDLVFFYDRQRRRRPRAQRQATS